MSAPWWVGVGPAEATVPCGPNHHRLRWEDGRVTAVDHPDPAGEAVLAALGGEEPVCLTLVKRWEAHAADPGVLILASRHPGDGLVLDLSQDNLLAGPRLDPPAARRPLLELLALEAGLQRRLQLEVAVNLLDALAAEPASPGADSMRAILEAATVGRLVPAVRRWAGAWDVEVRVAPAGVDDAGAGDAGAGDAGVGDAGADGRSPQAAAVVSRPGGVAVTVGWHWLTEVWGRYLTVVGGFLVLGVDRIVEDRAEVRAVAAPGGEVARLLLRGPAPWHVIQRLG